MNTELDVLKKQKEELEKDIELSKIKLRHLSIQLGKVYQIWIDKHEEELKLINERIKELTS